MPLISPSLSPLSPYLAPISSSCPHQRLTVFEALELELCTCSTSFLPDRLRCLELFASNNSPVVQPADLWQEDERALLPPIGRPLPPSPLFKRACSSVISQANQSPCHPCLAAPLSSAHDRGQPDQTPRSSSPSRASEILTLSINLVAEHHLLKSQWPGKSSASTGLLFSSPRHRARR